MTQRPPKPEDRPSSPRFKSRKEQQTKGSKRELPDDLSPVMAELMKQSDRGAAIIAGSLLEQILETAIKARLRPLMSGQHKALFGRMAPLSTFSAKIELGYVIGLYNEVAYKNFNMVREVRNKFAHEFDALSFDHPDVAKIINDPERPPVLTVKSGTPSPQQPRGEFMAAFSMMGALMLAMKHADVRLPTVVETHAEILSAMSRALDEAIRQKQAAERAQGPRPESTEQKP